MYFARESLAYLVYAVGVLYIRQRADEVVSHPCPLVTISFVSQHGAITTEESIKKRQSEYQKMVNR